MRFLNRLFAIIGGLGTRKPPRLVDSALAEIDREAEVTLSMPRYLDLLAEVPLPTQQQKENFAAYVSQAHSWYKHLPYHLPGTPFYFFIDKYAGFDRVLLKDSTAALRERVKHGFHYSDIPTNEYRTKFGHLAYSCAAGTVVLLDEEPIATPRDKVVAVPGDDAMMYGLPPEIVEAGRVRLTAAIHTLSAAYPFWARGGRASSGQIDWPDESGGHTALVKILERCHQMCEPGFKRERRQADEHISGSDVDMMFVDRVLYRLTDPERQRQRAEIVKAVDRVCEVIEKAKRPVGRL